MKKSLLLAVFCSALAVTAVAAADDGRHGGRIKDAKVVSTFTNTDNGSCGNRWAVDVIRRTLKVHDEGGGVLRVKMEDSGTFSTLAGPSPGACNKGASNGRVVRAGVVGRYHGIFEGTITGGTFDRNAHCGPTCTQSQYIHAFFGAGATFSCWEGGRCRFDFVYVAKPGQRLVASRWQDRGTATTEVLKGDIASR